MNHAQIAWQLSQFMHGEQGALIVASQLVGAVPWMDAKYYAATQTMDEARHVEVFSRYLREKLEWEWPINPNLKKLLDVILLDSRWDMKYLGMHSLDPFSSRSHYRRRGKASRAYRPYDFKAQRRVIIGPTGKPPPKRRKS